MTFGAMLRAYGRVANLPPGASDARGRELNAGAEELLRELSVRFLAASGWVGSGSRLVEPTSQRTNMTYDTGPRSRTVWGGCR